MKTEQKIIRAFIDEKTPKTIREISKRIKSDYRITHTATKRLLEKKILSSTKVGKSTLCTLNNHYFGPEIYLAEHERKEYLLHNKDIQQLYKEIMRKINSHFFVFIIFGSYAKGKATIHSDIDIIILTNEKECEERVTSILSLLPLKTHALVFTEEEFIRMKDAKTSNVIKEAMKNNIILYGTEHYYRIKNA